MTQTTLRKALQTSRYRAFAQTESDTFVKVAFGVLFGVLALAIVVALAMPVAIKGAHPITAATHSLGKH